MGMAAGCGPPAITVPAPGFIAAPSITTPDVTYFHSATSSFRASATIAILR
jgi:hypothetical protein